MQIFSNFYFENITLPAVVRIKRSKVEVEAGRAGSIFPTSPVMVDRGLKLMRGRHPWDPLILFFLSHFLSYVLGNTLESTFRYLQNLITFTPFEC